MELLKSLANKASESFIESFGRFVRLPCPTRWNSQFDALDDLVQLDEIILNDYAVKHSLTPLSTINLEFLKEFVECVRPIARALDKLQGEQQTLMASLIPTILETNFQLSKLENKDELKYCKGLVSILMESLKTRFAHVFNWEKCKEQSFPFVMATISSPKLKMKWIEHIENKSIATNWLIDEAQRAMESIPDIIVQPPANAAPIILDEEEAEYEFMTVDQEYVVDDSLPRLQVMQFLNDGSTGYGMLDNYPLIKTIFFKFNAGNKMFINYQIDV